MGLLTHPPHLIESFLFLEHLAQQTAEDFACGGTGVGAAAGTAKQTAQDVADVAGTAGVLTEDGEQVRSDGGQNVGYLVVRGAGLTAQVGDHGTQIAAENLLQDLLAILNVDADALTRVAAQRLKQRSGTCCRAGILLHGTQKFRDSGLNHVDDLVLVNVELFCDFTDQIVAGERGNDTV